MAVQEAGRGGGPAEIDLHDVRHSYATADRDAKIDWKALSQRIGHAEDARESALETATLLYGDRRPIVSHPEGRLPVSPVRYLAPTEGPSHAYRAASPKDEIPWQY